MDSPPPSTTPAVPDAESIGTYPHEEAKIIADKITPLNTNNLHLNSFLQQYHDLFNNTDHFRTVNNEKHLVYEIFNGDTIFFEPEVQTGKIYATVRDPLRVTADGKLELKWGRSIYGIRNIYGILRGYKVIKGYLRTYKEYNKQGGKSRRGRLNPTTKKSKRNKKRTKRRL